MGYYAECLVLDPGERDNHNNITLQRKVYRPADQQPSKFVSWQYSACGKNWKKVENGLACIKDHL